MADISREKLRLLWHSDDNGDEPRRRWVDANFGAIPPGDTVEKDTKCCFSSEATKTIMFR